MLHYFSLNFVTFFKICNIMKNLVINPAIFRFMNPCKQLDTSGTNVFKNSLNLSQNVEPIYCKECTHVYQDTDVLQQNYNPCESSQSSDIAANYNQTINTSENAA